MEKPKLKILYSNIKKRIGVDRKKIEEYHVTFKFDTPEQREQFKEDVKAWYNNDCCKRPEKYDGNYIADFKKEADFYKAELKKAGIKFHPNAGLEKLRAKYDEYNTASA